MGLITGIAHVNLTVPLNTLHLATEFYSTTLGLTSVPVPVLQRGTLAWFDITPGGQQIHISFEQRHRSIGSAVTEPESGAKEGENWLQNGHEGKGAGLKEKSSRHPCFKLGSADDLEALKRRIWEHFQKGVESESAPLEADRPGEEGSGTRGVEYPTRFFARDFAGNLLEFSL